MPRGKDSTVVKECFVPKLDAFLWADYPNIELKLLAFYLESIGHPSMAEVFRQGADLHTVTACGVLGLTPDWKAYPKYGISDDQRQIGKRLNFSIVYGGGVPTITSQLGITSKEALNLLKQYHATWPGIGWQTKTRDAADGTLQRIIQQIVEARTTPDEPGYIKTMYGRHLHPRKVHAALNNLCQGGAADLKKWAMWRCHQGLTEGGFVSHLVNDIHDELMFDCITDELLQLNELVPEWMTDPRIEAVVPIRPGCDLSFGTWADKAPFEEVWK